MLEILKYLITTYPNYSVYQSAAPIISKDQCIDIQIGDELVRCKLVPPLTETSSSKGILSFYIIEDRITENLFEEANSRYNSTLKNLSDRKPESKKYFQDQLFKNL